MRCTASLWGTLALVVLIGCGGSPEPKVAPPPLLSKVRQWQAQGQRLLGQGEWELAKSAFEDARQLAESLDDLPGVVETLNSLGAIAVQERRADEAVLLHRRALALAEETRQSSHLLPSLTRLAAALQVVGHTAEAQERYQRALSLAQESRDRKQEAVVLNNLGLLDLKSGALDAAKAKFESARAINQSLGEKREWSANLLNLGLAAEAQGQLDDAQRQFESALELDKSSEHQLAIAGDLASLARILGKRGNKSAALSYYQRAYWSYRAVEDAQKAKSALERALALARELGRNNEVKDLEQELAALGSGANRP
jgi:tetratricopeptide (TPR) repeat protein